MLAGGDPYQLEVADTTAIRLDRETFWLVPGAYGACLTWGVPGLRHHTVYPATCNATGNIDAYGLTLASAELGAPFTLVGLVPNNSRVSLTASDGTKERVRVVNNIFLWHGPRPASITLNTPSVHKTIPLAGVPGSRARNASAPHPPVSAARRSFGR
jgi:hypothetical protein